jgi:hypothetical protein
LQQGQSRDAIARGTHLLAFIFEHAAQHFPLERVVFDHQDQPTAHGSVSR